MDLIPNSLNQHDENCVVGGKKNYTFGLGVKGLSRICNYYYYYVAANQILGVKGWLKQEILRPFVRMSSESCVGTSCLGLTLDVLVFWLA